MARALGLVRLTLDGWTEDGASVAQIELMILFVVAFKGLNGCTLICGQWEFTLVLFKWHVLLGWVLGWVPSG